MLPGLALRIASADPALGLSGTQAPEQGLRVFISVDMEGLSGIVHSEMTSASGAEYGRAATC